MEKLQHIDGVAAPLMRANIDTDIITPGKRIATTERDKMGEIAFEPLRFNDDGSENPDFVLNQDRYRGAQVLVTGPNFGCGSSRETAVWALHGLGIRCVIGESFGDIFYNNCFQNAVLPIRLSAEEVAELATEIGPDRNNLSLQIDVAAKTITAPSGKVIHFELAADRQQALLQGLDDISQTLQHADAIADFQSNDRAARAWIHATPWQSSIASEA
jgi:3-isopropylmalate/(R)-2-methylmalate dehydratase small subunit